MNLVIALAAVGLITTGVVYIIADDILNLPAPITGTQALAIGMGATLVPLVVVAVLDIV
jgi:hypothetical protein